MTRARSQAGGIRTLLLVLVVLAAAGAGGWWWFLGRFARPDEPPERVKEARAVLDYVGRRDLGLDPLDAMAKPNDAQVGSASIEARVFHGRWQAAWMAAFMARTHWKGASTVQALVGEDAARRQAESARLEYLHQAQTAEYWRARYVEAGGS